MEKRQVQAEMIAALLNPIIEPAFGLRKYHVCTAVLGIGRGEGRETTSGHWPCAYILEEDIRNLKKEATTIKHDYCTIENQFIDWDHFHSKICNGGSELQKPPLVFWDGASTIEAQLILGSLASEIANGEAWHLLRPSHHIWWCTIESSQFGPQICRETFPN